MNTAKIKKKNEFVFNLFASNVFASVLTICIVQLMIIKDLQTLYNVMPKGEAIDDRR